MQWADSYFITAPRLENSIEIEQIIKQSNKSNCTIIKLSITIEHQQYEKDVVHGFLKRLGL